MLQSVNNALKRQKILNKMSKSFKNIDTQSTNTTNNDIIKIRDDEKINYNYEAEQVLSNYMLPKYASQIVESLYDKKITLENLF